MRASTTRPLGLLLLAAAAGVPVTLPAEAYAFPEPDQAVGFQVRPPASDVTARTLRVLSARDGVRAPAKVWVYFTDKQILDSQIAARRLDETRASIVAHAAARRAKAMRGDIVDFYDIPVPEVYVSEASAAGAVILRRSRWLNAISVRASVEALAEIARFPFVHKITPVRALGPRRVDVGAAPPPEGLPAAGARFDYGPSYDQLAEIGVVDAHNAGYSGRGVIVGMLDTGFKRDHPAFQHIVDDGRLLAQWDFVNDDGETMDGPGDYPGQQDHGSATWSALAGFFEGELIGPAYGASFVLAKTEDITVELPVEEDNWIAAAEWADSLGVDVISSSLAYWAWYTPDDMDGDTAVITIGADIAASRGIVVCTGAGNMGDQDWRIVTAPADGDSVVAVGAVDAFNEVAGFSSRGPTADGRTKPEVVARGLAVVCACNYTHDPLQDEFATTSGTSMSCPLVAGCAAILIEAAPSWPAMTVREALMMTADNAADPDNDRGWGRVNVMDALDYAVGAPALAGRVFDARLRAAPNPSRRQVVLEVSPPAGLGAHELAKIEIFDVEGRRVWTWRGEATASEIVWDGRSAAGETVSPGVFFVRMRIGDWRATSRVVIQR